MREKERLFTILLVCTGNTCRSPMAAGILRRLLPAKLAKRVKIVSAGTEARDGESPSRNAIEVCRKKGIDISRHTSRRLTRELLQAVDLILVMQGTHMDKVRELCESRCEHTLLLTELEGNPGSDATGIPDPCGGSEKVYEQCFGQIQRSLERGNKFLLELIDSKESSR